MSSRAKGPTKSTLPRQSTQRGRSRTSQLIQDRKRTIWARTGLGLLAGIVVLLVIYLTGGHVTSNSSSAYPFQVGQPAKGSIAPDFTLPSNRGGTFSLAQQRGKTVVIFFQEGIDCQPCWKQLQDIQSNMTAFRHAGISEFVSITTNSVGALQQAAKTYSTSIPVLSDANLSVSRAYHANSYTMMGTGADGHSFVVVGPSGRILWRADYGGAPNYTMDVPIPILLRQMKAGMAGSGA